MATLVVSFFWPDTILFTALMCATILIIGFAVLYVIVRKHLFPYVLRRVGEAVLTLFFILTAVFILLRTIPGGPFDSDKKLPPEVLANLERKYGMDDTLLTQYLKHMQGVLTGDFGESYKYISRPVSSIITDSFPVSLKLGIYSLIVAYLIGIPLGVFAASKHNTKWDTFSMLFAMGGVTLPSFLIAALLILFFSFQLGLLPPGLWEGPEYYILPVLTLGLRPATMIARLTRSSALDVIKTDFIRTAYAKGLAYQVVLFKHVLRNSLIPVLTYSGPLIADILTGAFIVEHIFAIPGMGKHFVMSVQNRDYPLVMGLAMVYSIVLVFSNLLVDIFYSVVDPRIRLG